MQRWWVRDSLAQRCGSAVDDEGLQIRCRKIGKGRSPMQRMILCDSCQEPMVLVGIGSGEERMQDVTCEHSGILLEVAWLINGSAAVRAEPRPK